MDKRMDKINNRYQLRSAAGLSWLIDMQQEGIPYKQPIMLNEVGAFIWKYFEKGYDLEEIASAVAKEYEVDSSEVIKDVEEFLNQLRIQGIEVILRKKEERT